ncbi:MAG: META domain-containing protein [Gammaproteobacteria bacterium]
MSPHLPVFKTCLISVVILIAGCGGGKPQEPLDNTAWRAIEIKNSAAAPEVVSTLIIEGNTVARGAGGCNNFTGVATIETNTISFSKIAATRRMCDETANQQELSYFDALATVSGFVRDNQDLKLENAAGDVVIVLNQVLE